jgi:outer membrane protein assembly factor BamB
VRKLTVLCAFDTGATASFQSGLIKVGGLLYGTTATDTFAIDPSTCAQVWRVHEEYQGNAPVRVNRGVADPASAWGGWIYATDADTGAVVWKLKTSHPVLSGVTPTASGFVFVGDIGGTLYALDAESGRVLWSKALDGALGGGVITYRDRGAQRIAVAISLTSRQWRPNRRPPKWRCWVSETSVSIKSIR